MFDGVGQIEAKEVEWVRRLTQQIAELTTARNQFVLYLAWKHGIDLNEWDFHLKDCTFKKRIKDGKQDN